MPLTLRTISEYLILIERNKIMCKSNTVPEITGTCEWCKTTHVAIVPTRDIDEGMFGSLYDVCPACVAKQNRQAQEELDKFFQDPDLAPEDFEGM